MSAARRQRSMLDDIISSCGNLAALFNRCTHFIPFNIHLFLKSTIWISEVGSKVTWPHIRLIILIRRTANDAQTSLLSLLLLYKVTTPAPLTVHLCRCDRGAVRREWMKVVYFVFFSHPWWQEVRPPPPFVSPPLLYERWKIKTTRVCNAFNSPQGTGNSHTGKHVPLTFSFYGWEKSFFL